VNRKPLGRKSYGSIPHLPGSRVGPGDHKCHDGQARIATEKVRDKHDFIIVQEKLDGSNVGVAKIDGQILALTRAGYRSETSPFNQHWLFKDWVEVNKSRFDQLLDEGERVCGEWLIQAHGTRYDLPHEPFVPFDIMTGGDRISFLDLRERVLPLGFVLPGTVSEGPPLSIADALTLVSQSKHGALDPVEGAVWRIERKHQVDFLVKYVRPEKADGIYLPELSGKEAIWNSLPGK
jgi:hypothetical protein